MLLVPRMLTMSLAKSMPTANDALTYLSSFNEENTVG